MFFSAFLQCIFIISIVYTNHASLSDGVRKVNKLTVLLPVINEQVSIRSAQCELEAYGGCYNWEVSKSEFIKIIPFQEEVQTCSEQKNSNCATCFNKCLVQVNSNNLAPGIIYIKAIDKITNYQIQVECRLGKLFRLEILTKFRTVDVNKIQVLEVIGYDEEGNAFSSLEGLRFQWKIEQLSQYLEFVPIKDSQIQTSEFRKKLETPQFSTDIIIVRGLTVGKADIKVSIKEENQNVASANVTLYVIEQFILFPETNHLYFLVGQRYQLKIFQVKKESNEAKYEQVNVPSQNFEFSSQDDYIASIDQTGTLDAQELGQTTIYVNDKRTARKTIMTNVYVVDAIKIEMRITEFKDDSIWDNEIPIFQHQNKVFNDCWNLVANRFYYLKIQISDINDNIIYLNDKSPLELIFPKDVIEIVSQKQNQQYKILAKKICIESVIQSVFQNNGNQQTLQTSKIFQILSPVKIIRPSLEIYLPYIEKRGQQIEIKGKIQAQQFQLFTIGGSSAYHYQIEKVKNDNILSNLPSVEINQEGLIITQLDTGRTKIIVSDKLNKDNNDYIFVNVQKIGKAEPLEKMKELLLDTDDSLFVLASDISGNQFSNCSEIQFNIQNKSAINFIQSSPFYSRYQNNQDEIHSLIKNNKFFQQILFKQNDYLKPELYQYYIDEKIISQQKLLEILQLLDNKGICSKIALKGKQQGTYIAKIELDSQYLQIDFLKQFSEIQLKIINPIAIITPFTQQRDHDFMHVIMSFGSSFELKLTGGPTQWQGERILQIKNQVLDISNQQLANNSLIIKEIQNQQFLATCFVPSNNQKKENKYGLSINFQNTPDILLPQPLLMQIEIRVSCNFPYYLKIFYLPYYTEYQDVLDFQYQNDKILNFRSERTFTFKIQAFDSFQKPFYNISSLQVEWLISNQNFGQIEQLESFQQTYIENYLHHLIRNVKFFNQEGRVKITANTKNIIGYKELIFQNILAELEINLCKNVQVSPTSVLMYVNHSNTQIFFLHFGSGNFLLKEQNSKNEKSILIERENRKFTVQPLLQGQTNITIIDLDVQSSQNVSVTVEVLSIYKIVIYLENYLLPIGKTTKLIYEVYGSNGLLFPSTQHKFMDIDLIIESDKVSEAKINDHISYQRSTQADDEFIIQSKKTGQFKIYAQFRDQKRVVKSEFQEIELFENLRTEPSYVLIAPNCISYIYILGGPIPSSLIQFVYQADQEKLLNIVEMENRQFMIKGLQNGTSEIEFSIKQINNDQILTSVKLPIQVSGFNRVLFNNVNEREVHIQTKIRLISELYLDKRQFNQALCPFIYKWSYKMIDHAQVLVMQENLNKMNLQESNLHELDSIGEMHKFALNISMLSPGYASIQLDVSDLNGHFKARNFISFKVIDPQLIQLPTYIGQPKNYLQSLLLPPNSNYKLPIVRQGQILKNNFKECLNNVDNININENGVVQVGSIVHDYGLINLQVEDQKSINIQSQIISLVVTSISSIFIENSYQMLNLQLGSDSILEICLQDSYGRSFPDNLQDVHIVLDISNKQIIEGHIDSNLKLQLTSRQAGASLIKVYLQNQPAIYDQFLVIVGSIITPKSPIYIHTGGVIQFKVETSSQGNWTSENSDILYIDLKTGLAQSLKQGKATIVYQSQVKFKTVVTIYQITEIQYKDEIKIINVISNYKQSQFYKEIYWFQIEAKTNKNGNSYLRSVKDFLDETSELNNNLQIECKSSHPQWVSVQFEEVKGMPFCKLVPKSIKSYTERELIPQFINLQTIISSRNMALIITLPPKDFKLQVQWEFVIPSKILKLNRLKFKEKVTIITPQRLEIRIEKSHTDTIDLSNYIVYIFNSERNSMEIDIDLSKCLQNLDQYIVIKNTNTQQQEQIRVNYSPSDEEYDDKSAFSIDFDFQDFLLGLVAIGIFLICYTQFVPQKQQNYRMQ